METLSITSKEQFSLETTARILSQRWRIEISPHDITVHDENNRAYLHLYVELNEYGMHHLLIDYSNIELAKSLIELIADDKNLTVDNDFGTILPGNEFVARCKAKSQWDWRR